MRPNIEELSKISKEDYARWYRPIWEDVPGARAGDHPAPFPVEIPFRLARMLSFAGDTVLDPFGGSFTTSLGAMKAGRNSIGVEIAPSYFGDGITRLASTADSYRQAQPALL